MSNVGNNSVNNVSASGEESRLELYVNLEWKEVEFNGVDSKIPKDWHLDVLGEMASFRKGKGLSKKDLLDHGVNKCIHYGELFTKYGPEADSIISKTNVEKDGMVLSFAGDVLMPTSDVTPKGLATATSVKESGVILGGDILVISPNSEKVFPGFLSRVIRKDKDQIMKLVSGSTVYHIYAKDMSSFIFIRPPIQEQSLIAQALSTQEAQVADLRKLAALERQRLTWLSDELLSGRLRVVEDPTAEPVVVSRDENGEPVEVLPGVKLIENREWKSVEVNEVTFKLPDDWTISLVRDVLVPLKDQKRYQIPSSKVAQSGRFPVISQEKAYINGYTDQEDKVVKDGLDYIVWGDHTTVTKYIDFHFALGGDGTKVFRFSEGSTEFAYHALKGKIVPTGYNRHFRLLCESVVIFPKRQEQFLIAAVLTAQEKQAADIERLADLEQKRLEWLSDELLSGRLRIKVPA